ncbi:hypothetical protein [Sphingomonas sp. Root241]|uniref:hypothetical protein n=1 Tax=Sphingomonas sp. Root241 TaxID=1736501 RepID=UPI0006F76F33|nr:hypothetical protein [Sphingomonas sp. Root241]KRC81744.1 hypothetical protein ASE13_05060 [Sphingomonas sp. Root241]
MIALALAAALQTTAIEWKGLAPLPWRTPPVLTAEMQAFVQREAVSRNCPLPGPGTLTVEVAVLVDEANGIRTAVPRAIRCPTVEQYAAALVAGFARGNLLPRTDSAAQWYRASLTFTWKP